MQPRFNFSPSPSTAPLTVHQDVDLELTGERTAVPSHGATVWDSAILLARALSSPHSFLPDLDSPDACIVELGAGTGLAGMAAARLFPSAMVLLTDQAAILPLLRLNVQENFPSCDAEERVRVQELQWGDETHIEALPRPSLLLAADVLYHAEALDDLTRTLRLLDAPCLLAYCVRSDSVRPFLETHRARTVAVPVQLRPGDVDDTVGQGSAEGCSEEDCVCDRCCDGRRVRVVFISPEGKDESREAKEQ